MLNGKNSTLFSIKITLRHWNFATFFSNFQIYRSPISKKAHLHRFLKKTPLKIQHSLIFLEAAVVDQGRALTWRLFCFLNCRLSALYNFKCGILDNFKSQRKLLFPLGSAYIWNTVKMQFLKSMARIICSSNFHLNNLCLLCPEKNQ